MNNCKKLQGDDVLDQFLSEILNDDRYEEQYTSGKKTFVRKDDVYRKVSFVIQEGVVYDMSIDDETMEIFFSHNDISEIFIEETGCRFFSAVSGISFFIV